MRRIGQLTDQTHAERLRDYLAHLGTAVHLQPLPEAWGVWVLEEDQLAAAREELEQFAAQPEGERFVSGAETFRRMQAEKLEAVLKERREELQTPERRRRPRSVVHSAPLTFLVVVLCGVVTAAIRFGDDQPLLAKLLISDVKPASPSAALPEIRHGELWRLVTPSLIHFDVLHLLGNAAWMYLLGRVVEQTRRRSRYGLLLVIMAAGSNLAQYFVAGPEFGGLSGVVCGLFGYLWFKTHFRPEAGFSLPPEQTILFAGWMVVCLTGLAGPVANTAHLSGVALGMLLALPRSVPVFR